MSGRRRSRGQSASSYATTRMTGDDPGKKPARPLRSGGPLPDGTAQCRPHGRRERHHPDDRAGDWDGPSPESDTRPRRSGAKAAIGSGSRRGRYEPPVRPTGSGSAFTHVLNRTQLDAGGGREEVKGLDESKPAARVRTARRARRRSRRRRRFGQCPRSRPTSPRVRTPRCRTPARGLCDQTLWRSPCGSVLPLRTRP